MSRMWVPFRKRGWPTKEGRVCLASTGKHPNKLDIVAIGSSAGGLRALSSVLSAFPADLPAAVLVVQHLDPRYPSHMAEILARRSPMRVVEAADGEKIEQGTVYMAPPDRHTLVERNLIRLTKTELVHFVRPSVDLLFESVAAACFGRVIGVILTGSGTDGALGIRAIKEKGGFTITQDPEDAESTGMPTAAIATGLVDLVLKLEAIGLEIANVLLREGKYAGDQ